MISFHYFEKGIYLVGSALEYSPGSYPWSGIKTKYAKKYIFGEFFLMDFCKDSESK